MNEINEKLNEKENLDEQLQQIRSLLAASKRKKRQSNQKEPEHKTVELEYQQLNINFQEKKQQLQQLERTIKNLVKRREDAVHTIWGQIMKVGLERSRFAHQLAEYSCLYTSQVANLRFYSPFKRFIAYNERMPHD